MLYVTSCSVQTLISELMVTDGDQISVPRQSLEGPTKVPYDCVM